MDVISYVHKGDEHMKEMKFCQSCGMPLGDHLEESGLEKDGSKSGDYCKYCYQDGAFTQECTMEQMIEGCLPFEAKAFPEMSEAQLRARAYEYFPTLKRWAKDAK